jgi:hypothetical protein
MFNIGRSTRRVRYDDGSRRARRNRTRRLPVLTPRLSVAVFDVAAERALALLFASGQPSCALDVADQGGTTLDRVGDLLAMTRERVRQIELVALARARHSKEAIRP